MLQWGWNSHMIWIVFSWHIRRNTFSFELYLVLFMWWSVPKKYDFWIVAPPITWAQVPYSRYSKTLLNIRRTWIEIAPKRNFQGLKIKKIWLKLEYKSHQKDLEFYLSASHNSESTVCKVGSSWGILNKGSFTFYVHTILRRQFI